jgi:hypothetical protein
MTNQYIKQGLTSLSMPNDKFAELMESVLKNGTSFRFQASGFSMSPLIKNGDVITLSNPSEKRVSLGDVVAFINDQCGKLTVHRIVGFNMNHILIKADNSAQPDGWMGREGILGSVTHIERFNRPIRFGLGLERYLIAFLSRYNLLMPSIRVLRLVLRPFIKNIYHE